MAAELSQSQFLLSCAISPSRKAALRKSVFPLTCGETGLWNGARRFS